VGISLPQRIVVIVVIIVTVRGVVILVVVISDVIAMDHVNMLVARTGTRRAWCTRGSDCRITAS
jgi:hypothetical protein